MFSNRRSHPRGDAVFSFRARPKAFIYHTGYFAKPPPLAIPEFCETKYPGSLTKKERKATITKF